MKMSSSKFVHRETLTCSKTCIPCLYKIFPEGKCCIDGNEFVFPPNKRPEMCPRSQSQIYNGLIDTRLKVLTVGDGDFSFSLSLARHFGKKSCDKLICTSHESNNSVLATYANAINTLNEIKSLGAHVFHDIDATNIPESLFPFNHFDVVIWNFPCVRVPMGADGQVSELDLNKKLLKDFFIFIQTYLRERKHGKGEVHIAHKTIEPFQWWDLPGIADSCGFKLEMTIVFDRCLYPGYINRKVLDRKSFPSNDALIYIFTPKSMDIPVNKCRTFEKDELLEITNDLLKNEVLPTLQSMEQKEPPVTKELYSNERSSKRSRHS